MSAHTAESLLIESDNDDAKGAEAALQTIRTLLKPVAQHSFSEDRLRNDRQSYITMTRALVDAQLEWRDAELSSRLWKDVTKPWHGPRPAASPHLQR